MTPRPQMDSDSGNIKNSTTQECRVGFHGKCRRYQREFSSDSLARSLARRECGVRVAFADREIDFD